MIFDIAYRMALLNPNLLQLLTLRLLLRHVIQKIIERFSENVDNSNLEDAEKDLLVPFTSSAMMYA